jgi:hypothetical protein
LRQNHFHNFPLRPPLFAADRVGVDVHGDVAVGVAHQGLYGLAEAKTSSLVIYGEPQSGKTEMMICLTAKLLDDGHPVIVHLMNDSVDLLTQNLKRFKTSGLAPAARNSSEMVQSASAQNPQELVVFCKKNARDLNKLIAWLNGKGRIVVIDDEADYATPNAKINQGTKTRINELVGQLIGTDGYYIGVTATPARPFISSARTHCGGRTSQHRKLFRSWLSSRDYICNIGGRGLYRRIVVICRLPRQLTMREP